MIKKIIALAIAAAIILPGAAGCGTRTVTTGEVGVVKDKDFGNIYIGEYSVEEFNALGFEFGDSIDITFNNGKSLKDVPYYSGYYAPVGEMLACGYDGYSHVMITYNYGEPTWEEFGMTENSKVTVTLSEKGKYGKIEELYAVDYSDYRKDYPSDAVFANFREIKGGNLKPKSFYRSASPCDNRYGRAACANSLAQKAGVKYVLNLSDNADKYNQHKQTADFRSYYYDALVEKGDVLMLGMNANYRSEEFAKSVAHALFEMTEHNTPVLIHCHEGKDRTGSVSMLLLALAGASAEEITKDYMMSYANYYGLRKENDPEKYEAISEHADFFLRYICTAEKGSDISALNLKSGAENYLQKGGLNKEQIAAIEKFITK